MNVHWVSGNLPGQKFVRAEIYQGGILPGRKFTRTEFYQGGNLPGRKFVRAYIFGGGYLSVHNTNLLQYLRKNSHLHTLIPLHLK